ncbi:MAG: hotdog fold thioesterase [Cytophagales bacterium]|nr:hotdog fold thioesterase [Cytophagales bacterium]
MIRFKKYTTDQLNEHCKGSMYEHIGIKVTEIGDDYLKATMPLDSRTRQSDGTLHRGALSTLAESLASMAATLCVDNHKKRCSGLTIHSEFFKPVKKGCVNGVASPIDIGDQFHVWEVKISDDDKELVCVSKLRIVVLDIN